MASLFFIANIWLIQYKRSFDLLKVEIFRSIKFIIQGTINPEAFWISETIILSVLLNINCIVLFIIKPYQLFTKVHRILKIILSHFLRLRGNYFRYIILICFLTKTAFQLVFHEWIQKFVFINNWISTKLFNLI
jgi:hypothetical protein